jgi:hypothetical protein
MSTASTGRMSLATLANIRLATVAEVAELAGNPQDRVIW